MGSKQSKRSVDISGKDGEAAGAAEVVAAGGEGRVEAIADADTLKPQLNGDTPHIVPPEELSEKEKQLENGTQENEKDATTEKETVVTNGSGGDEPEKPDQENGDAKPTTEADTKKNKKEKVKKKWSLSSISFSRKEKPKQEKKHKTEEPKTNGETDKLPEEGTEASAVVESKSSDDVKEAVEENKDEKTPETPVTEPITNGNSAPETPKEEAPAKAESPTPNPVVEKLLEENKASEQPDNLPLNGLSLDEPKAGTIEVKMVEAVETKLEESPALATVESASVPDTPIIEVCAGQSSLTETTPPPLPSNPPPSSLTAFAETTMAPHLVDASLTSQSQTSLPITATAEIASSIVNLPLPYKVDQNTPQNDMESSTTDTAVDASIEIKTIEQANNTLSEKAPADVVTNETEALVSKESTQECADPIKFALEEPVCTTRHSSDTAESSETLKTISNDVVESIAPFDSLNNEGSETENTVANGLSVENTHNTQSKTDITNTNEIIEITTDSVKSSLQQSTPIINEIAEGNTKDEEKINGPSVETDVLSDHKPSLSESSSPEIIDSHMKPETPAITSNNDSEEISASNSEVIIENGTCDGESPLEALPPPVQDVASETGEGNCGSNEEISESFPLPPSELCRSESEASGSATPEPSQEVAPVTEVIAPEILTDKALIAEIKEVESSVAAASETVAVVAGAGDGAPSD